MKRLLQTTLCLLAVLHLVGGHWGLMQMIAWSNMLRTYSQNQSILAAVKDTFDGKHPCPMCIKIQQSQKQQSEQQPATKAQPESSPVWLALLPSMQLPSASWKEDDPIQTFAIRQTLSTQWQLTPPTPPPRRGVELVLL